MIDDRVPCFWILDLVIPAEFPFCRMAHNSCPYHVQIDVSHTLNQMGILLYCRGVITILPESPFPAFSLVILLACPARDQLDGLGDNLFPLGVPYHEVNVVRGDRIVQNRNPKTLPRLEQPLQPPALISGEFQQEFPLVTSMGDVPNVSRNVVPIRPCQDGSLKHRFSEQ